LASVPQLVIAVTSGFRNRMAVAVDWLWSYLTYERGARLITGEDMRMSPPGFVTATITRTH
jgi:hypothetical protein